MIAAAKEASDWLSPVLVKEMRQGLKSKAFVGAFLLVHVGMLAGFAFALAVESPTRMRQSSSGLFWTVTVISLLGVVPLMGFNAISSELKGRTFELMVLTRLTAWRVVVGKWASLVAQAGLIVSSLLPYLVARYFLGGVNLVLELFFLGLGLFAAAFLVAMSVFVSTFEAQVARLLLIGTQLTVSVMSLSSLSSLAFSPGASPRAALSSAAPNFALALAVATVIVLFVLQAAATRVAPPAENHAAPKRALAGLLLLMTLLPADEAAEIGLMVALVPALLLMALEACGEPLSGAPSAYLPYARWPGPLALLASALYPGWPSGLVFAAGLATALAAVFGAHPDVDAAQAVVVGLAFLAAVSLPIAFARLPKKLGPVGFVAALVHLLLVLGAVVGKEASGLTGSDGDDFLVLSPLVTLVEAGAGELDVDRYALASLSMAGWLALSALLLLWRGRADLAYVLGTSRRAAARRRR